MKKILLIITIGLFTVSAFAQETQKKHEFSIWAGGGISSLEYDVKEADHKMGLGGMAGLGYNYYFNYNWSLGIGAEFQLLQAKAEFDSRTYSRNVAFPGFYTNGAAGVLNVQYDLNGVEEKQMAYYINIPLMLRYQMDLFKRNKLYLAIGPKVGIAVMDMESKFSGKITTTGIEDTQVGMPGVDPYAGLAGRFGTFTMPSGKTKTELDLNIMGSFEAGIKWPVKSGKNSWYTGLFVDYGFKNIRKGNDVDPNFFHYNGKDGYAANGVINSNLVDKVHTFALGAKVQFAFGFGSDRAKKVKIVEEKPYEGLTADQLERIMDKNTGKVVDAMDRNFDDLKKAIEKECPELLEAVPTDALSIVQFDFDKADVKNAYYPDIDRKVAILKQYPEVKMTLIGHTDDRGTEAYNYDLGLKRAQHVKDYMVHHGIAANRLFVESKGKTQPIYPNTTDENRYKNRRVEFELRK